MADEDFVMQPVVSSQIESVGYNPKTKELRVKFIKNGSLYSYSNVPSDVFVDLVYADSVGRYFAARVKNNSKYAYRRIG